jgi:hypothetical protein
MCGDALMRAGVHHATLRLLGGDHPDAVEVLWMGTAVPR